MNDETTPRQVLYALVGGGFLAVVAVLIIGAATAGLVPVWWTIITGALVLAAGFWSASNWRRTGRVLIYSIALFMVWAIGTLIVA